ncbi:serine/arginine repetitive matrix protein 2-like [Mercenaria mercenaria]|uniref:serine/arginine repetitive matrix protein 2-like n=1 Tax=Mercenaria mercenaria TaxID=6596 RepID=UPI00234EAEF1|nr:serine/arginine repetitive matrix protein 2-like [Mercenaria mercenaria]
MPFSQEANHHHGLDNALVEGRLMEETIDAVERNLDKLKYSLQNRYSKLVSSQIDRLIDSTRDPNRNVSVNISSREIRRIGNTEIDIPAIGSEKVDISDQADLESERKVIKTPEITRIKIRQYRKIEHNEWAKSARDQDADEINKIGYQNMSNGEKVIHRLSGENDKFSNSSNSVNASKAVVPLSDEIRTGVDKNLESSENMNGRPEFTAHPAGIPLLTIKRTSDRTLTTNDTTDTRSPILTKRYARSPSSAITITVRPVLENDSPRSQNSASASSSSENGTSSPLHIRNGAKRSPSTQSDGGRPVNRYDARSPALGRSSRASQSPSTYETRGLAFDRRSGSSPVSNRYDARSPPLGLSSGVSSPPKRYNTRSPLSIRTGAQSPPFSGTNRSSSSTQNVEVRSPPLARILSENPTSSSLGRISVERAAVTKSDTKSPTSERKHAESPIVTSNRAKAPLSERRVLESTTRNFIVERISTENSKMLSDQAVSTTSTKRGVESPTLVKTDTKSHYLVRNQAVSPTLARRATESPKVARNRAISPTPARLGAESPNLERRNAKSPDLARNQAVSPTLARRATESPELAKNRATSPKSTRIGAESPNLGKRNAKSPDLAKNQAVSPTSTGRATESYEVARNRTVTSKAARIDAESPNLARSQAVSQTTAGRGVKSPEAEKQRRISPTSSRRSGTESPILEKSRLNNHTALRRGSGSPELARNRSISPTLTSRGVNSQDLARYRAITPTSARRSELAGNNAMSPTLAVRSMERSNFERKSSDSPMLLRRDTESPILSRSRSKSPTSKRRGTESPELDRKYAVSPTLASRYEENYIFAERGTDSPILARSGSESPTLSSRDTGSPKLQRKIAENSELARYRANSPATAKRGAESPRSTRTYVESTAFAKSDAASITPTRNVIKSYSMARSDIDNLTLERRGPESSTARGNCVDSPTLARGGAESPALAKGAVESPKLATNAIESLTSATGGIESPVSARIDETKSRFTSGGAKRHLSERKRAENSTLSGSKAESIMLARSGVEHLKMGRNSVENPTSTRNIPKSPLLPREDIAIDRSGVHDGRSPMSFRNNFKDEELTYDYSSNGISPKRNTKSPVWKEYLGHGQIDGVNNFPSNGIPPKRNSRSPVWKEHLGHGHINGAGNFSSNGISPKRSSRSPVWKEYLGQSYTDAADDFALRPTSVKSPVERRLQKMVDRLEVYNRSVSPKMEKIKESLSPRKPLREKYATPAIEYYVEDPTETADSFKSVRSIKQKTPPALNDKHGTNTREQMIQSRFTSVPKQHSNTNPTTDIVMMETDRFKEPYNDNITNKLALAVKEYPTVSHHTQTRVKYNRKEKDYQPIDVNTDFSQSYQEPRKPEPQTEFQSLVSPVSDDQPSETRDTVKRPVFSSPTQSPEESSAENARAVCLFCKSADGSGNKISSYLQNKSRKDIGLYRIHAEESESKTSGHLQNNSRKDLSKYQIPAKEIEFETSALVKTDTKSSDLARNQTVSPTLARRATENHELAGNRAISLKSTRIGAESPNLEKRNAKRPDLARNQAVSPTSTGRDTESSEVARNRTVTSKATRISAEIPNLARNQTVSRTMAVRGPKVERQRGICPTSSRRSGTESPILEKSHLSDHTAIRRGSESPVSPKMEKFKESLSPRKPLRGKYATPAIECYVENPPVSITQKTPTAFNDKIETNTRKDLGKYRIPAKEIEFKTSADPVQKQGFPEERRNFTQYALSDNSVPSRSPTLSSGSSTFLFDSSGDMNQQPLAHSTPNDKTERFSPVGLNEIAKSEEYCASCRKKETKQLDLFQHGKRYRSRSNRNKESYCLDKVQNSDTDKRMWVSRNPHRIDTAGPSSSEDTREEFALSLYTNGSDKGKERSMKDKDHQQDVIGFKSKEENQSRFEELVNHQMHQLTHPGGSESNTFTKNTIKQHEIREIKNYDDDNRANRTEEELLIFKVIRQRIFPVDNKCCQADITQEKQMLTQTEKENSPLVIGNEAKSQAEKHITHQTQRADGHQKDTVTRETKEIREYENSSQVNLNSEGQEMFKTITKKIHKVDVDIKKDNDEDTIHAEKPKQSAETQHNYVFKRKEIKHREEDNTADFNSSEIQTRSSTGIQTEIFREHIGINRNEQSSQIEVHLESSIEHKRNTDERSFHIDTDKIKTETVQNNEADEKEDNTNSAVQTLEDEFQREIWIALSANIHRLYEDIERTISTNALPKDDIPPETIINEAKYMFLNRIETLLSLCSNLDRNEFRDHIEELIGRLHGAFFEQGARSRDSDYMDEMRTVLDGLTILKENFAFCRERLFDEKTSDLGSSGFMATVNKHFKRLLEYFSGKEGQDDGRRIFPRRGRRITVFDRLNAFVERHLYVIMLVLGIILGISIVFCGPSATRTMSDFAFSRFMYVLCNVTLTQPNPPIV